MSGGGLVEGGRGVGVGSEDGHWTGLLVVVEVEVK